MFLFSQDSTGVYAMILAEFDLFSKKITTLNFAWFVKNVDWQVQAMNDVSPLSPFPPQFASINFTTSQSGELFYLDLILWCNHWVYVCTCV